MEKALELGDDDREWENSPFRHFQFPNTDANSKRSSSYLKNNFMKNHMRLNCYQEKVEKRNLPLCSTHLKTCGGKIGSVA